MRGEFEVTRAILYVLANLQRLRWLPPPVLLWLWQLEKRFVWDNQPDDFDPPPVTFEVRSPDDSLN